MSSSASAVTLLYKQKKGVADMQKRRLLWIVVLTAAILVLIPHPAYAYIDPGTTGSIFAMLAPFIAIFLAFLGFLIRPFKRFFASMVARLQGSPGAESVASNEQPASGGSPDDERSREDSSEDLKG